MTSLWLVEVEDHLPQEVVVLAHHTRGVAAAAHPIREAAVDRAQLATQEVVVAHLTQATLLIRQQLIDQQPTLQRLT